MIKTKTIRQSIKINALPSEIYDTLMSSAKHTKFTGSKARITNKTGGKFSAYGGSLTGVNKKLIKGKKIVQSWYCSMPHWPKNHYSQVTFNLKKIKNGTSIQFIHSNVPIDSYQPIKDGWYQYYWNPLKRYFSIKK